MTLTATGEQADTTSCSVEVGEAVYETQLHEGAGGSGTAVCSGDLLLGALAACSQLTAQAVIENIGVAADVPVGFQALRMDVTLRGELSQCLELFARLIA